MRRLLLALVAVAACLGGCDYMKLLNIRYDPVTAGAPRYPFNGRAPVGVVLPFAMSSTTNYGSCYVGEFVSTFGTLEDRAFAESSVNDIVAGAMADELSYGGFTVYDERNTPQFAVNEEKLAELCRELRRKHPDADFAVGGTITRFWARAKSFFWAVRVNADVELQSYVIDVRSSRIIFKSQVTGSRNGARQYVGAGRMKILLQEALAETVGKTLRNPQVVEFFNRTAERRAAPARVPDTAVPNPAAPDAG